MKISDVIQLYETNVIDLDFINEIKIKKPNLSNSDKKKLLKRLIRFKELDFNDIEALIKVYAIWCPDESISEARKKGLFRYKAHGLAQNTALELLNSLLKQAQMYNFNSETIAFLEKKRNLSWLFECYVSIERRLIKYINNSYKKRKHLTVNKQFFETALFKELLVYADFIFGGLQTGKFIYSDTDLNKLENYSIEELSNAISYIIFLYNKTIGIKQDKNYFVDEKCVNSDEMNHFILQACKIIELEQWELTLDFFDYSVLNDGNKWIFEESENKMEKSLRAGYIQYYMQENISLINTNKNIRNGKMGDSFSLISENLSGIFVKVEQGKLSRYRFQFPVELITALKPNVYNELYFEEVLTVSNTARELCMDYNVLLQKKITKSCNVLDLILFKRFFAFIFFITNGYLLEKKDDLEIIYQSLIPSLSEEYIIHFSSIFLDDKTKCKELLDLLTHQKSNKLDLQYTPFIRASGNLLHPNALMARSNSIRNAIAHSYTIKNQEVNDDGGIESLVTKCAEIFRCCEYGYKVYPNRKYKYQKQNGEIDLIVVCDENIILIECKSPLHPCNNFEIRSSLDHISKGEQQLNHAEKAFNDVDFRKRFFKDSLKIDDYGQIVKTCIVFGNRLFSGYKGINHPIRYIYELDNVLNKGIVSAYSGNDYIHEYSVWEKEKFNHNDLIIFLSKGADTVFDSFRNLLPVEKYMCIEGHEVIYKSYAMMTPLSNDILNSKILHNPTS